MVPGRRVFEADFLRGTAIVLMVIFHFCFDLNHFGYADFDIYRGEFWKIFRIVIVSTFLVVMGASLVYAYSGGINLQKVKKRVLIMGGSAALITFATIFIFPKSWIYFGIIHFVLVASVAGLLFVKRPQIALLTGIAIVTAYQFGYLPTSWLYDFLQPVLSLPVYTEDIVRFFPWFGVVLIGIFLGHKNFFGLKIPEIAASEKIALLGRHSLLIYLVHQPVLFGAMMVINQLS